MAEHGVDVEFVKSLAREGGAMIKAAFLNRDKRVDNKISNADLVTETDVAVEKHLISKVKAAFPTHSFLCEESSVQDQKLTDEPTWIMDPIDGTTNFVHSFPMCCASIAFAVKGRVEIGVVYNPNLDELFWATRGGGAYLNGQRIRASNVKQLRSSLASVGFAMGMVQKLRDPQLPEDQRKHITRIRRQVVAHTDMLIDVAHDIRRIGSAALDLCQIAAGRTDVYFEICPKEWDIAGGMIIVEEAGGHVCDYDGSHPLKLDARRVMAASCPEVAHELVAMIKQADVKVDEQLKKEGLL
eukprot:GDKI01021180.1.p1 GENE.GDKI01021180.1~~GDKI01021180.1.p1  ORF type:complete len:298 (-),score=86.81 GDKI01021180.1:292-1185(-)